MGRSRIGGRSASRTSSHFGPFLPSSVRIRASVASAVFASG